MLTDPAPQDYPDDVELGLTPCLSCGDEECIEDACAEEPCCVRCQWAPREGDALEGLV